METTAFDLIAHPAAIEPPWGFLAIFWAASTVIVAIGVLQFHFGWRRGFWPIFALFFSSITIYGTWTEINLAQTARAAVQAGNFLTVAGCLSTFHPGKPYASKTIDADEVWTLNGEKFEYGEGGVGFAWRRVEPLGGVVHADSRVSATFVRNEAYSRNEILRLKVQNHACPRAIDPGPP